MKLGVFDSGLGGLSIVARLQHALPEADIAFFSDQAHLPYGDRSVAELHGFLLENIAILHALGPDAIVMGCNTTCAIAADAGWPTLPVPIFDLIAAGAAGAHASGARRHVVVATAATVRTHAYAAAITARDSDARVLELAAPELVPLVEAGAPDDTIRAAVNRVLAQATDGFETIVLGCSHYSLIAAHFAACAPHAVIIDPADVQARNVAAFAKRTNLRGGSGRLEAWTNADPKRFEKAIAGLNIALRNVQFGAPRSPNLA